MKTSVEQYLKNNDFEFSSSMNEYITYSKVLISSEDTGYYVSINILINAELNTIEYVFLLDNDNNNILIPKIKTIRQIEHLLKGFRI